MDWTRIKDPDEAARLLPAWFSGRMIGARGTFGLLLATGDVMRITSITAVHHGADGTVLVDVILDHAGAPEGVDLAWQAKHYLGVPVPAAVLATVNLAHVVAAVEFVAAQMVERPGELALEEQEELRPKFEARNGPAETAVVASL